MVSFEYMHVISGVDIRKHSVFGGFQLVAMDYPEITRDPLRPTNALMTHAKTNSRHASLEVLVTIHSAWRNARLCLPVSGTAPFTS